MGRGVRFGVRGGVGVVAVGVKPGGSGGRPAPVPRYPGDPPVPVPRYPGDPPVPPLILKRKWVP